MQALGTRNDVIRRLATFTRTGERGVVNIAHSVKGYGSLQLLTTAFANKAPKLFMTFIAQQGHEQTYSMYLPQRALRRH